MSKTFIRTIDFATEAEKDKTKEMLNNEGFYCLSRGTSLEVYAIADPRYFLGFQIG